MNSSENLIHNESSFERILILHQLRMIAISMSDVVPQVLLGLCSVDVAPFPGSRRSTPCPQCRNEVTPLPAHAAAFKAIAAVLCTSALCWTGCGVQ
jgi:hypothetical protein